MSRIHASDALSALTRIEDVIQSKTSSLIAHAQSRIANDVRTIATFIAGTTGCVAPEDNTGLPCPYCDQKLPKLSIERTEDDRTIVRVSGDFEGSELRSLLTLLRGFVPPKGKRP